jgi:hypothetical protein
MGLMVATNLDGKTIKLKKIQHVAHKEHVFFKCAQSTNIS